MREFETETFKMIIHDDLIKEVIVKKNKTFTEKDVRDSIALSTTYKPNVKFYALMEGEENTSVSGGARRLAASEEYTETIAALALCSDKLQDAILGNLYLKISKPKVLTKFFDNRDKALEWLRSQYRK